MPACLGSHGLPYILAPAEEELKHEGAFLYVLFLKTNIRNILSKLRKKKCSIIKTPFLLGVQAMPYGSPVKSGIQVHIPR